MKVLSIDLGTKNLAFCVLEQQTKGGTVQISRWGILNIHDNLDKKTSKKQPTISELNRALQRTLKAARIEEGVNEVAIENQPAGFHKRANTKMKTLSHCIEAFMFLHLPPQSGIRFVNPKSKFAFSDKAEVDKIAKLKPASKRYREHKRMAVEATEKLLRSEEVTLATDDLRQVWATSKKKDDLADSFLQGLFVLK